MSKRLAFLEKLVADGSKDPFHHYALANEYANGGREADALKAYETLVGIDATYVPAYLMCGQMLAKIGRKDEARSWLTTGIGAAKKKGDSHALSEMETALSGL